MLIRNNRTPLFARFSSVHLNDVPELLHLDDLQSLRHEESGSTTVLVCRALGASCNVALRALSDAYKAYCQLAGSSALPLEEAFDLYMQRTVALPAATAKLLVNNICYDPAYYHPFQSAYQLESDTFGFHKAFLRYVRSKDSGEEVWQVLVFIPPDILQSHCAFKEGWRAGTMALEAALQQVVNAGEKTGAPHQLHLHVRYSNEKPRP